MVGLFFDEYGFLHDVTWLIAGVIMVSLLAYFVVSRGSRMGASDESVIAVGCIVLICGFLLMPIPAFMYRPHNSMPVGTDKKTQNPITSLQDLESGSGHYSFKVRSRYAVLNNLLADFPNLSGSAIKKRYKKCAVMLKELGFEREDGEAFIAQTMHACRTINKWREKRSGSHERQEEWDEKNRSAFQRELEPDEDLMR